MSKNAAALAVINGGFSAQREKVELEFESSEVFRNLCEEFEQCSNAIEHWKNDKSAYAEQREQEYVDLLAELHREIKFWLQEKI
jgi:hypothetical protein